MFKNHFKIAWRNLTRNKISSLINIGGLTVGMTVALLIGLWIHDELSFNKYHKSYDRIGRVMIHNGPELTSTYNYLPMPLAGALRSGFPGDFKYVVLTTGVGNHILAAGDKKFTQAGSYMGPEAPDLLTLKMLKGARAGLTEMNSIFLTESLAQKLFGNTDPIGKIVKMDNDVAVKVTGVFEDLPLNTSFSGSSFIAPFDLMVSNTDWAKADQTNWGDNSFQIFVQLESHTDFNKVSAKIKDLELNYVDKQHAAFRPELFVHPMSKWHLYSSFENRVIVTSEQLKLVWFYGFIGLFVLLLACINFMNLSTARSEQRAKEVGIRKAVGSMRSQLIGQFFCESLLTAVLAFVLSIFLVRLMLPWFNGVAGKGMTIPWKDPLFWLSGLLFTLITGLLAGSYPALYLSSFNPVKVLKGAVRVGRWAAIPRKALVVFQFTVSIALIIGTLIVYRQIQFVKNRPVGYSREGLLQIQMTSNDFQGKYEVLSSGLKHTGVVSQMTESSSPVTGNWSNSGGFDWKGKDPAAESDFAVVSVTPEYGSTVGFQLVDGRDFSRDYATDSSGFIINEAAARYMGLQHPVGETIKWDNKWNKIHGDFKILGVVKDMVINSPFEKVKQTIYRLAGNPGWITIRISPAVSIRDALPKIEGVFKKIIPSAPFDYSFVEEQYAAKFAAEERIGTLASFFAIFAVFISCLGLFGLASFVAEQRTKEIGVRKVLGASVLTIWQMLSMEFVALVVIACLLSIPIAWYFMREWLQKYEYHSQISGWIFVATGLGAIALTLLTISYRAIKAAIANPVQSLRAD